jgi:hypothetical protein
VPRSDVGKQIQAYRDQLSSALDAVQQLIDKGQYDKACTLMTRVSQLQAQASMQMRSILIRDGLIKEDDDA